MEPLRKKLWKITRIYRVDSWFYYLGFILIGSSSRTPITYSETIPSFFAASLLLAYAFSLNDFYDKKQRKKFFMIPFFFFFFPLFFLNPSQILVAITFFFIVTVYSMPPIRLKSKPLISTFCNGFAFSLLFFLGYLISTSDLDLFGVLFFLLFFYFNTIAQLIHEVVDYYDDKKHGITTTAIFFGKKWIKKCCYILLFFVLSETIFLFYFNWINFLFFIAAVAFSIFFIFEFKTKRIDHSFREKYRRLGIVVGVLFFLSFHLKMV